jgi:hypothetical protein
MTDLRICKVCEIHVCFKWTKTTHVNDRPNMYIQGCVVNIEKADIYPLCPQHVAIHMEKTNTNKTNQIAVWFRIYMCGVISKCHDM